MSGEWKGWRPTTREYDPDDKRPIGLLHPPKNTPPEVIEALWGGDLGEDPRKVETDVEDGDDIDLIDELELEENLLKHLEEKGYVLLWSELFQDYVAFYMRDDVLEHIPAKYVTYSDQELKDLFSEGKRLSQKRLKFIHNIKKVFGSVILIESDTPGQEQSEPSFF